MDDMEVRKSETESLRWFMCAKNNISLFAEHVPGVDNEMADALSRLQEKRFARLHPTARKTSTPVLRSVWTIQMRK